MNIALETIKNQILPFVDGEKKQKVSKLTNLDEVENFIERYLEKDFIFEIQNNLLSEFEKPQKRSVRKNEVIAEMPLFDSLEEPDSLGYDEDVLPTMSNLNEALHDLEHYVASNLIQVVVIKKKKKQINDWDVINNYGDLISNSNEFSRLKRIYVMSIHNSIENPTEIHAPVRTVNKILGYAKEVIDSINALKIENESRKSITTKVRS